PPHRRNRIQARMNEGCSRMYETDIKFGKRRFGSIAAGCRIPRFRAGVDSNYLLLAAVMRTAASAGEAEPLPHMHRLRGPVDFRRINLLPALQTVNQEIDFVVLAPKLEVVLVAVSSVDQRLVSRGLKLRDGLMVDRLRGSLGIVRDRARERCRRESESGGRSQYRYS